ncbi:hypothetical protein COMNV_01632 [Commensalibacter sp. Nvir]|uniref:hypothetical protein n=1 Tax=Commensalibacter sp. Nvir TaxID=3069817 RepID=UPI002D4EBDD9|nr:hypothetical protein COMNV_01632 [Commensalibacter sp. Nvir]
MITNEVCVEMTQRHIQKRYGDVRNVAKKVAVKRGWSMVTFKNWLYGKNAPRMQDLIVLMADCPELEKEILEKIRETRKCLQQL